MAELSELAQMLDISLAVDAVVPGPLLTVGALLALRVGSLITTARPAGETVDLVAAEAYIGAAELGEANGRQVARMVRFEDQH